MSLLSLDSLTVRRGPCPVVDGVSLSIGRGECVGLVGPNGAGKTTLMRAALGLLPFSGASSLAAMSVAGRARAAAWLPQTREIAWPVSVEALVALGRLPHLPRGARLRPDDQRAVNAALSRMDLDPFRDRPATELSGGEQARALIARALAQETPLLIADEPTAGLDPAHQIAAMEVFRALADEGRGVLVSLHDLGLAARHCDRLILMDKGRVVADGAPEAVLNAGNLAGVFRLRARFIETGDGRMLQIIDRLG